MSTFNLKEVFNDYGWSKGFKFEIVYSKQGVACIYIGDRKTSYTAGGYGYDKESSVIATMINDLIGEQKYNKKIYGNNGKFLSGGTGFSSIKESFEYKRRFKLEGLYSGFNSDVYQVTVKTITVYSVPAGARC